MNILITGGHGFIGQSLLKYFSKDTDNRVFAPGHKELDLLDLNQTQKFIENNYIDCVIHTAIIIGRRFYKSYKPEDSLYNIYMFENIIYAARNCKYFINFGSGGEFGIMGNIKERREEEAKTISVPIEYGGFAKYVISKRISTITQPLCFNLRIAGCFGFYEKEDRFIKANLNRVIDNMPLVIHRNRFMDFIYIEDLYKIVEFVLSHPNSPSDINCVYNEKFTLIDIAYMILAITNSKLPIVIEGEGIPNEYTLDGTRLSKLGIPMIGLEKGIEKMYKELYDSRTNSR